MPLFDKFFTEKTAEEMLDKFKMFFQKNIDLKNFDKVMSEIETYKYFVYPEESSGTDFDKDYQRDKRLFKNIQNYFQEKWGQQKAENS